MFVKLLIISTIFILIALAGLGIRILLKPKGQFPDTHISHNKEMQKRGITCARHTDTGCNPSDDFEGCDTCDVRRL